MDLDMFVEKMPIIEDREFSVSLEDALSEVSCFNISNDKKKEFYWPLVNELDYLVPFVKFDQPEYVEHVWQLRNEINHIASKLKIVNKAINKQMFTSDMKFHRGLVIYRNIYRDIYNRLIDARVYGKNMYKMLRNVNTINNSMKETLYA